MSPLELILNNIVEQPERETEWLELLSLLEYVGARKLFKSVPFHEITATTLKHMHEEAQHAYLLKRVASDLCQSDRSWRNNPLFDVGYWYLDGVDKEVTQLSLELGLPPYALVTAVIEERALVVYPPYLERTRNPAVQRVIRQIMTQERSHLALFPQLSAAAKERAKGVESVLWNLLYTHLQAWSQKPEFALPITERLDDSTRLLDI